MLQVINAYAMGAAGSYTAADADYSYSRLMLSFAGSASFLNTQMVDESIQRLGNRTAFNGNTARVNTAGSFPAFENASVRFDGTGDRFGFPSSTFPLGSDDFSMSLWPLFDASPTGAEQSLIAQWGASSNQRSFDLRHNNSTNTLTFAGSSDGVNEDLTVSVSWTPGTTLHFLRIEREGPMLRIWRGPESGTAALLVEQNIGSFTFHASTVDLLFGAALSSLREFRGNIAAVDLYLGATFQHSNASFSVPSARNLRRLSSDPATPVPSWANVVFSILGAGADGTSASIVDISSVGRTVTKAGNIQADTAIDIFGTSILGDGTGDFMSMADASDLKVNNTTGFCWEGWWRIASSKVQTFYNKRDGTGAEEFTFGLDASNIPNASVFASGASVGTIGGTAAIAGSTVFHAAYTRENTANGDYLRLFIDGYMVAIGIQTGTPSTNTSPLYIGRDGFNTGRDFNGSSNHHRGSREPVYTHDFTVPTPPLPTS
jgi:hypothetical protein